MKIKLPHASLLLVIVAVSLSPLNAQQKALIGVLTVASGNVTINGQSAVTGRSVFSPSTIVTSTNGNASIGIPMVGIIVLKPNSTINLSFNNSSISGDGLAGCITIETFGQTALNLLMTDGTLNTTNPSDPTTATIAISEGQTNLSIVRGEVLFNQARFSAGQTLGDIECGDVAPAKASGDNKSLIFLLVGAAAAAIAGITLGAGGGGDTPDSPPVSPIR
jgi:hypothetical protein